MSQSIDLSREAGERFGFLLQVSTQDAMQQRLRYHLLRLTTAGLTREDVDDLGKLCGLAFQDSDVREQAAKLKERADVSPLAFAIADILESAGAGDGPIRPRTVMLGAVLGAYASLRDIDGQDEATAAVIGAIGGAIATSTSALILDNLVRQAAVDYLRSDE